MKTIKIKKIEKKYNAEHIASLLAAGIKVNVIIGESHV